MAFRPVEERSDGMTKKYKIEYPELYWELNVEIDEDFKIEGIDGISTTREAIKSMVEFWAGWQRQLKENGGDYTITFLKELARTCLYDHIGENHNMEGVISYFEDEEGWFAMDGSNGIKITFMDETSFAPSDFAVTEVSHG
jgi:hypothetical protein